MAKNIEINIKNNDTQYEQLYPKSLSGNIYLSNDSELTIIDYVDNHKTDDTFEIGDILLTNRKNISDKWHLCDGSNLVNVPGIENVLNPMPARDIEFQQTSGVFNYYIPIFRMGEDFFTLGNTSSSSQPYLYKFNKISKNFEAVEDGGIGDSYYVEAWKIENPNNFGGNDYIITAIGKTSLMVIRFYNSITGKMSSYYYTYPTVVFCVVVLNDTLYVLSLDENRKNSINVLSVDYNNSSLTLKETNLIEDLAHYKFQPYECRGFVLDEKNILYMVRNSSNGYYSALKFNTENKTNSFLLNALNYDINDGEGTRWYSLQKSENRIYHIKYRYCYNIETNANMGRIDTFVACTLLELGYDNNYYGLYSDDTKIIVYKYIIENDTITSEEIVNFGDKENMYGVFYGEKDNYFIMSKPLSGSYYYLYKAEYPSYLLPNIPSIETNNQTSNYYMKIKL